MENLMNIASYICSRYESEYGTKIDEMKLHKLLYFAQRESLIQNREPLFDAVFWGWKYGPVIKEIRSAYRDDTFYSTIPQDVIERTACIMNKVFEGYAWKDSWSLSRLTHGEYAWKHSREGISENDNSDNPMCLEDMRKDADRIRERREMRARLGLS